MPSTSLKFQYAPVREPALRRPIVANERARAVGARISDLAVPVGGIVFGTAGQVDHGKTALVRSLTGADTAGLTDEKQRAVSAELAFADLRLPNNKRIAIVDVPGHDRFIRNMLAGTAGIDAVLLVVAADSGLATQTREHLEICRLLNVQRGVIAITKTDLVSEPRVAEVRNHIQTLCRNTFLDGAPCVAVSVERQQGLDELIHEISKVAETLTPRPCASFPRLAVDRSFTIQGFGTVVTGTLQGGRLNTGDIVEIHPMRQQVRIRGIQVHRKPVGKVLPGHRTAVNLTGIDARQIQRGSVLTAPGTLEATTIFDACVEWLDERLVTRARQSLKLYAGCAESSADVRLISTLDSRRTLTRLSSREPLLVLPGDRFIIRNAETTVGGGTVIDPFPPIRVCREKTSERLEALMHGTDAARLRLLVEEGTQGKKISNVVRLTGWTTTKIRQLTMADPGLTLCEAEKRIISLSWLDQKRAHVAGWLEEFHKQHPSAPAAPMHLLRSSLMSGIEPTLCDLILEGIREVSISTEGVALKPPPCTEARHASRTA